MAKVLFLLHMPPPVHGSSMVGEWIHKSELINNAFDCRYINMLASRNVSESGSITVSKLFLFISSLFRFIGKLLKSKPDLCYFALTATGIAFYRDVLFVLILKIFRIKHIYHLHNKGVKDASTNKLNNVLYHFVFKNTDVILLSEYLYPDVQQYVLKNRILICPNGIPSKILPPKNKSQKKDGIVKILFLSNLIESKGVFVLLEAMGILKHKDVLFEGLFVGGEGDISEIQFQQRVNQLNIQEQVHYLGKKYGTDKEKIFNEADIFAFPTYYSKETFGIVNLEAMQHELPIVSTPEGGIPDIVHNGINGFLVPPKDSVQLAEKLEKLILNRDLRIKMGKAGKKIYEENYTANIFEKRLLQVLLKQIQTD